MKHKCCGQGTCGTNGPSLAWNAKRTKPKDYRNRKKTEMTETVTIHMMTELLKGLLRVRERQLANVCWAGYHVWPLAFLTGRKLDGLHYPRRELKLLVEMGYAEVDPLWGEVTVTEKFDSIASRLTPSPYASNDEHDRWEVERTTILMGDAIETIVDPDSEREWEEPFDTYSVTSLRQDANGTYRLVTETFCKERCTFCGTLDCWDYPLCD